MYANYTHFFRIDSTSYYYNLQLATKESMSLIITIHKTQEKTYERRTTMRDQVRQWQNRSSLTLYLIILAAVALLPAVGFTQGDLQDVVYLKDGSIVRGVLIEQVPGVSVKIQTADGSVFVYQMDQIEKITKEMPPSSAQVSGRGSTWNAPLSNKGVLVNLLGIVQFGPIIEGEFKINPNMVVGPHLRLSGLGLLYHLVVAAPDWGDVDEVSMSSMAVGATFKYFAHSKNSPHRFYLGGSLEYGWGSSKGDVDVGDDEWTADHAYIAILSNFGYRWRYESGFFLNVGALAGVAINTKDEWYYSFEGGPPPGDPDYGIHRGDGGTVLAGMLEVSFGKEF